MRSSCVREYMGRAYVRTYAACMRSQNMALDVTSDVVAEFHNSTRHPLSNVARSSRAYCLRKQSS